MYNPQLETFIRVADAGSFNKAAEQNVLAVEDMYGENLMLMHRAAVKTVMIF